jgi:hypothetical protein
MIFTNNSHPKLSDSLFVIPNGELEYEEGLMKMIGNNKIPEPDTIGDWLRRMGDIRTEQSGLKGLDKVRDTINHRILRREGILSLPFVEVGRTLLPIS